MKRIALPSDDGSSIAAHFGRCAAFLVFETEGEKIVRKEIRANGQGGAHHGECHGAVPQQHDHGRHHAGIGQTLRDCETILCRGMGWGAAEALKASGIEPLVIQTDLPGQEAVEAYLAGSLPTATGFGLCHH